MSTKTPVQACISGYGGIACTLLSLYDPETGLLLVNLITPFEARRQTGCLTVTTVSRMDDYDALFTSDHIGEAIEAYESLLGGISYSVGASRANPSASLQVQGYDQSGVKRAIDEGITNEKVALLATCWAISSQDATTSAIHMADEIHQLLDGGAVSIGGDSFGDLNGDDIGIRGKRFYA